MQLRSRDGKSQVALMATGTVEGAWPACLTALKRSALEVVAKADVPMLALLDRPVVDVDGQDEADRQRARTRGYLLQLAGPDEDLHYIAYRTLDWRESPGERRADPDENDVTMQNVTLKTVCQNAKANGQIDRDSWVCRLCGYPNPRSMRRCRGYLDAQKDRIDPETEPWFWWRNGRRDRQIARRRTSTAAGTRSGVRLSTLSRLTGGSSARTVAVKKDIGWSPVLGKPRSTTGGS